MLRTLMCALLLIASVSVYADGTGPYVGGHLGYGFGKSDLNFSYNNDVSLSFDGFGSDGLVGGGLLGFTFYDNSAWNFSIEAEFSFVDIESEFSVTVDDFGTSTATGTLESYYAFTGKLGYAVTQSTDVFIKAGGVIGDFEANFNIPTIGSVTDDETQAGFLLGFGTDIELSENLRLVGEYQYMGFEEHNATEDSFIGSINVDAHLFRAGFLYSF